jgi:hypothetical protein
VLHPWTVLWEKAWHVLRLCKDHRASGPLSATNGMTWHDSSHGLRRYVDESRPIVTTKDVEPEHVLAAERDMAVAEVERQQVCVRLAVKGAAIATWTVELDAPIPVILTAAIASTPVPDRLDRDSADESILAVENAKSGQVEG